MDFIKKHAVLISLILLLAGAIGTYFTNNYDISSKTISTIKDNNISCQVVYSLENQTLILNIFSILSINVGIALFISSFFLKYIEKDERENFYNRLETFQKETAKDAILSSFERLIDKDFFEIIKADILNAKFQRYNLRWQYDIVRDATNNTMTLTRTINYLLKNISSNEEIENFSFASFSDTHSSTETITIKSKLDGETSFTDLALQTDASNGILTNSNKEIKVPSGKTADVVMILKQTFPRDYIYETHFLNKGAVDLELTVNLPVGYEFSVNPTVLAKRTEKLVDETTKKVFRIKGAIYNGQGIEFMCFPSLVPNVLVGNAD